LAPQFGTQIGDVANVEIADLSEEIKREDRFVWVGLYEPDEKLLGEIQEELGTACCPNGCRCEQRAAATV
jgi:hypothetical protein